MRPQRKLWILVLLPLVTATLFTLLLSQPVSVPARDRIVILITLDGFPAYGFDDPALPVPTLWKMIREGAWARRMTVANPSVTWPNHTTLVTGVAPARHGVLFNGLLTRPDPRSPVKVEPWRDKSEMVRVPTLYDLAHRAGLVTAQVDWIPTQNAGTIHWEFAERPDPKGAVGREMVAAGLLTEAELTGFNDGTKTNSVWRDEKWTAAAVHIIRKHRPNLLIFHLLNTDGTHHRYGPRTPAGYTALAYADTNVQKVVDALQSIGMLERATIVISSDHGFKTVRRSIRPNALLRSQGLLKAEGARIECDAYVVPEGGTAMVYVTDPANRQRLVPRLKELLEPVEGVEQIWEPAVYASRGLPSPEENTQMADLVLVARDGYSFSASHEGDVVGPVPAGTTPGSHGYPSSDPEMDGIFVAWGWGIRPGARLERIENIDVAPTLAKLLGIRMENVSGRELREILR